MTAALDRPDEARAASSAMPASILAIDGWSREQLLELQRERLRELVAHAVAGSPYYREALGPDAADAVLADLPTLPKPLLMEEFDRVVTDPRLRAADLRRFRDEAEPGESFLGAYRVFGTSGATGVPGLFVYTPRRVRALGRRRPRPARADRRGRRDEARCDRRAGRRAHHAPALRRVPGGPAGRSAAQRAHSARGDERGARRATSPRRSSRTRASLAMLAQEQLEGRLSIAPRLTIATSEVLTDETIAPRRRGVGSAAAQRLRRDRGAGDRDGSLEQVGMHVCEESLVLEVVDAREPPGAARRARKQGAAHEPRQPRPAADPLRAVRLGRPGGGPDPSGRPFTRIDARRRAQRRHPHASAAAGGETVSVQPHRLRSPFSALLDVRQYQIVARAGRRPAHPDCASPGRGGLPQRLGARRTRARARGRRRRLAPSSASTPSTRSSASPATRRS